MGYKLVLENGKVFNGINFGFNGKVIGELFFHTSMVGYQDILSDPSYYGKIACLTYPLIGNYGLTDDDYDFKNIFVRGYVVKENNDFPSNFRSTRTLSDAMGENKVVGIEGIDTRELTKIIRNEGNLKAMIVSDDEDTEKCIEELKNYVEEGNLIDKVSCNKIWYSRTPNPTHTLVVIDLGVKTTTIKQLNEYGFNVIVVPYTTTIDQIKKLRPHGIVVSNGPGNPNNYTSILKNIEVLQGKYPILAIGLGAQIMAAFNGVTINKMKNGHQGANIPVRNLETEKIEITSQNYFYCINELPENLIALEQNVVDKDIVKYETSNHKLIGVQYKITEEIINNFKKVLKK
jgi:carbamoyl-phosphate synthase small subunit